LRTRHSIFALTHHMWAILVAIVIFAFAATPAMAARCDALGNSVQVSVKTNAGKVVYRTAHGRADLDALQQRHGDNRGAIAGHPLGLTLAQFQIDMLTKVKILSLGPNQHCAALAAVEVTLSFEDFQVYIDRRYKRGSCEYRAILDHENQHVRLFRSSLDRYQWEVRGVVEDAARRIPPIIVARPNNAPSLLQGKVKQMIQPTINRMNRAADAANAAIDTPGSYASVQRRCTNW
jgi:hypothetical protein